VTTIPPELIGIARDYWQTREAHQRAVSADERHEAAAHRVVLHEQLLEAMRRHGIPFDDREHAARIARTWLEAQP
jgi:hypothetical protein